MFSGVFLLYHIILFSNESYEVQSCLQWFILTSVQYILVTTLQLVYINNISFSHQLFFAIDLPSEHTLKDNARLSGIDKLKELNDAEVNQMELGR